MEVGKLEVRLDLLFRLQPTAARAAEAFRELAQAMEAAGWSVDRLGRALGWPKPPRTVPPFKRKRRRAPIGGRHRRR